MLNLAFRNRAGIAEKAGVFQPAGTAPNDRLFTSIVPMYSAENLTAFATYDYLRKDVVATEGSFFPAWAGVDNSAADKLLLHLHKNFTRDDGLLAMRFTVCETRSRSCFLKALTVMSSKIGLLI